MHSDVFVIIRTTGERTLPGVEALAVREVGREYVEVVRAYPFAETLKRSYEAAITRDAEWTVCVDADVLFFSDVIPMFRRAVRAMSGDTFGIQGYVLDKFFGGSRPAGVRIYRTALLQRALSYIPFDGRSKRPETYVIKKMGLEGYRWEQHGILSGLHDFEQYYRDIYRTCFFHAQKHKRHLPLLRAFWERAASDDDDFLVALRGAQDGAREEDVLGLDARNFDRRFRGVLEDLDLTEKQPFALSYDELVSFIDTTADAWMVPEEYEAIRERMESVPHPLRRIAALGVRKIGLGYLFGIR